MAPFDDEITSSWLVRVAHAYHETPTSLARLVWGKQAVWNRDTDLNFDTGKLEQLGSRLGLPPGCAAQTSLHDYLPRLGRLSNALVSGILVAGIYHRTRRRHGQQYCPECLATHPVVLRQWRLAFVLTCPIHGCLLRDACPACDSPLAIHRSPERDVTRCPVCQACLIVAGETPSVTTRTAQRALLEGWASGTVALENSIVSFQDWLAGIRQLFSALQYPEFSDSLSLSTPLPDGTHAPLELSRIRTRAALLPAAVWLASRWPRRVRNQQLKVLARVSGLAEGRRPPLPTWLCDAMPRPYTPQTKRHRTLAKVRIPSRLSAALARRSLDLAPVITRRLNHLQARH